MPYAHGGLCPVVPHMRVRKAICVFMLDECHLLWGDLCGYVWGKSDRRIEVEMTNQKQRQTYYGALDYRNK